MKSTWKRDGGLRCKHQTDLQECQKYSSKGQTVCDGFLDDVQGPEGRVGFWSWSTHDELLKPRPPSLFWLLVRVWWGRWWRCSSRAPRLAPLCSGSPLECSCRWCHAGKSKMASICSVLRDVGLSLQVRCIKLQQAEILFQLKWVFGLLSGKRRRFEWYESPDTCTKNLRHHYRYILMSRSHLTLYVRFALFSILHTRQLLYARRATALSADKVHSHSTFQRWNLAGNWF